MPVSRCNSDKWRRLVPGVPITRYVERINLSGWQTPWRRHRRRQNATKTNLIHTCPSSKGHASPQCDYLKIIKLLELFRISMIQPTPSILIIIISKDDFRVSCITCEVQIIDAHGIVMGHLLYMRPRNQNGANILPDTSGIPPHTLPERDTYTCYSIYHRLTVTLLLWGGGGGNRGSPLESCLCFGTSNYRHDITITVDWA